MNFHIAKRWCFFCCNVFVICAKITKDMSVFKFVFLQIVLMMTFIADAFSHDLIVSFIDRTNTNNVRIEINQTLQLDGLKILIVNSEQKIIIPYYMKNNIQYPYFAFLDVKFKAYIFNSIKANMINGTPPEAVKYKISRIRHMEDDGESGVCASTFITFNDLIEIECFIEKYEKKYRIIWPSDKDRILFSIKDLNLKGRIENEILNGYSIGLNKNKI